MNKKKFSEQHYEPSWGIRPTPEAKPMTTYEMFRKSAILYPTKNALIFMDKKISYGRLDDMVQRFALGLAALGIKKGDRIGALLPNCPQHVIAFLAANRLGAIHVPANVMYKGEELRHIFLDSGIKILITLDLFYKNALAVMDGIDVEKIIVTGIDDFLPFPKSVLYRVKTRFDGTGVKVEYGSNTLKFNDLLKTKGSLPAAEFDFDETMLILYTAGTTGKSKGVMLTHRNFVYNAGNQAENFNMEAGDVNLVLFPMFHISGYLLATICMFYGGGTTILEPRFDAARYIKILHKYKVSVFFAPPTVYIAFFNLPDFDDYNLSSLKICGASGAPVPPVIQAKWKKKTGLDLLNGYGLTETTAGAIVSLPNKFNHDAIGVPMGGAVKIVDDQGKTLPLGERGEILFKGPQVARGYWNQPEKTAKTFMDGWLHTGDIGTMDTDGFIFFVDRQKDLIIASAYNIAPAEVEAVLMKHESIQEVAVIGVPDEYRGENVKAFVVLEEKARGNITEKEIIEYGKANMAAYKYPRLVEFIDILPKSPIQKVLRKELRDMEARRITPNE
ncbi:MAG: long-chain fatty acid--CoA ligase [Thermodesulfobacteriota bacterium]|nr:long-chain fatty acid--CoA ligase [Thermodesulfobacteriota bacterium]